MTSTVISGRVAVLFDRVSLPVGEPGGATVDGYRCRWCGWTYVVDEPRLIPDHECSPPPAQRAAGVPAP